MGLHIPFGLARRPRLRERRAPCVFGALRLLATAPAAASGQDRDAAIRALEARMTRVEADSARRIAEIEAETRRQIGAIRAELATLADTPSIEAEPAPPPALVVAAPAPRLEIGGDFRLRHESTSGGAPPGRSRAVLRARLSAVYRISDNLIVGGRLVTGDPDDPNSSDVTLSRFADDLDVSLDRAFVTARYGAVTLTAGRFENPVRRTELVWDNDVSLAGVAGTIDQSLAPALRLRAAALYFLVDESAAGPDSAMIGGQLGLSARATARIELGAALGYYDYRLDSVAGAGAGDIRSNRVAPNGGYQSDFDLLDATVFVTLADVWDDWPLRISGNYVRNLGAIASGEDAYAVDLFFGAIDNRGDWRLQYGYAVADTDAVLAAFSQDNIELGSNYRQHTLAVDYVPADHWLLTASLFRYQVKDIALAPPGWTGAWRNRVRLNVLYSF